MSPCADGVRGFGIEGRGDGSGEGDTEGLGDGEGELEGDGDAVGSARLRGAPPAQGVPGEKKGVMTHSVKTEERRSS